MGFLKTIHIAVILLTITTLTTLKQTHAQYIATTSDDNTVKIWNTCKRKEKICIKTLTGHSETPLSVSFCPHKKKRIASVSRHIVNVWNIEKPTEQACIRTIKKEKSQEISSQFGKHLILAAFNKKDKRFITTIAKSGMIQTWNIKKQIKWVYPKPLLYVGLINCAAFYPNETNIVATTPILQNTIEVLKINQKERAILAKHNGIIFSIAFSSCLPHILTSGSQDQTVKIWNIKKEMCIRTLKGHENCIFSVACNPTNPDIIASATMDDAIKVWDLRLPQKQACIRNFTGTNIGHNSLSFNPNNEHILAFPSQNHTVKLLDIKTEECSTKLSGHTARIKSVTFFPKKQQNEQGIEDEEERLAMLMEGQALGTQQVLKKRTLIQLLGTKICAYKSLLYR